MDDAELEQLAARVDALEREVAALRHERLAAPVPAPPAASAPSPVSPKAPRRKIDVESLVGGRGLLYAGAFLIVVGVASFLEIAFQRGWIGPSMRVALGILVGLALVAGPTSLRRRLHPFFADAMIGLGAAIEYLSLYGAGASLHLLPVAVVGAGTLIVTAALCALAYRESRAPLAYFGIVGGLIAPLLLGGGGSDSLVLYAYLAVLSAGAMLLAQTRGWRALPIVSLAGAALYWLVYAVGYTDEHKLGERLAVAIFLYAVYAAGTLLAWRRGRAVDGWSIAVASLNAAWFFIGIASLASDQRVVLAIVLLAIAAAHVAAGAVTQQRLQFWLATIALSFAVPPICFALAAPTSLALAKASMNVAWAIEGTAIGVLGARWRDPVLLSLAGAIFAAGTLVSLTFPFTPNLHFLLNPRFASLAAIVAGASVVRRAMLRAGFASGGAGIADKLAIDVVALLAITPEAAAFAVRISSTGGAAAEGVAVSIAWALYAAWLVIAGIRGKSAVSRWEGLVLFAITLIKVFFVDLTEFDLVFRVISAIGFGIVALIVAYLYQSRLRSQKDAP
ncbi:MAG TPA: DUF2339 domain-containing protein [Verrucomicrobiae bacterium]|nr:DUF2339 domain-containing protein [Verrucomicrobiae bacterium]